jgi:hypothetical protein
MIKSLAKNKSRLNTLPKAAFKYWRSITPIKTGNAKRRTSLKGQTILAKYPYAERLDDGWSTQAPKGMSKPTEEFIARHLRKIIRK